MTEGYELGEPRRYWVSKDNDSEMCVYVALKGRIPLSDLIAYVAERGIDPSQVGVNFPTVKWTELATPEESDARLQHRRRAEERHAKWERETYAKLRAKFEGEATP